MSQNSTRPSSESGFAKLRNKIRGRGSSTETERLASSEPGMEGGNHSPTEVMIPELPALSMAASQTGTSHREKDQWLGEKYIEYVLANFVHANTSTTENVASLQHYLQNMLSNYNHANCLQFLADEGIIVPHDVHLLDDQMGSRMILTYSIGHILRKGTQDEKDCLLRALNRYADQRDMSSIATHATDLDSPLPSSVIATEMAEEVSERVNALTMLSDSDLIVVETSVADTTVADTTVADTTVADTTVIETAAAELSIVEAPSVTEAPSVVEEPPVVGEPPVVEEPLALTQTEPALSSYATAIWNYAQRQGTRPDVTREETINTYPPRYRVEMSLMGFTASGEDRSWRRAKQQASKALCENFLVVVN